MRRILRILTLALLLALPLFSACGEKAPAVPADGEYTVQATLRGGSGKSGLINPTALTVEGGRMTATLVFVSGNYDYVVLDGTRYDVLTTDPGSTFRVPVAALDQELALIGDTVAMSAPHEVEYTLLLDSATLEAAER